MAFYKDELVESLAERVSRCASGDLAAVLEPAAVDEADALRAGAMRPAGVANAEVIEPDVGVVLALYHWFRYQVLLEGDDAADLRLAVQLFEAVAEFSPEYVPDDVAATTAFTGRHVEETHGAFARGDPRSVHFVRTSQGCS
ncbi:hypothetical protein ABZ345_00125 [Lentzea sp. NPDC005914]|uniref:hypothetical protein n=1 Tax=Lentzea sp. NPDC005914 TaxID=3154572 RepID=UPI0033E36DEA